MIKKVHDVAKMDLLMHRYKAIGSYTNGIGWKPYGIVAGLWRLVYISINSDLILFAQFNRKLRVKDKVLISSSERLRVVESILEEL